LESLWYGVLRTCAAGAFRLPDRLAGLYQARPVCV
jgi:hypothetical protein